MADGATLASTSKDRTVRFWDVETGETINSLNLYNNKLHAIAGLDDGTCAIAIDNMIKIYNPKTLELVKGLQGHTKTIQCMVRLPDGNLASAGMDR
jgi:WD40 repeat protein